MLKLGWDLVFTIINLLILYFLMRKFLFKPVMGIMEQREKLINDQFKSAKDAENKANELKATWEENVASTAEEKERIISEAKVRAMAEADKIVADANNQAKSIVENANKVVAANKEKAIREVESQVAQIAMIAAAKIVNDKTNEINNSAIYDEFLADNSK